MKMLSVVVLLLSLSQTFSAAASDLPSGETTIASPHADPALVLSEKTEVYCKFIVQGPLEGAEWSRKTQIFSPLLVAPTYSLPMGGTSIKIGKKQNFQITTIAPGYKQGHDLIAIPIEMDRVDEDKTLSSRSSGLLILTSYKGYDNAFHWDLDGIEYGVVCSLKLSDIEQD